MTKQTSPGGLTDLLNHFKNEIMTDLNCVQIGIIQSFDAATQTATVQIALKHVINVAADGTQTFQERPVLVQCPVWVMTGGLGRITLPIAKGDNCILLFCDRELDNWFTNGGVQAPTSSRMHDLSDGIAIVGLHNTQNKIANYFTGGVEIAYGLGSVKITEAGVVAGPTLGAGNGATGSGTHVTVLNGIVTSVTP